MAKRDCVNDRDETPDRRRVGRPRVNAEATTSVSTRLSISAYDELCRLAKTRRTSLAGALRDVLRARLK